MNMLEMVKNWLADHGYDGLYHPSGECACRLKDLMPCDGLSDECKPGYLAPCPGPESEVCDGDCAFHIVASNPEMKGE